MPTNKAAPFICFLFVFAGSFAQNEDRFTSFSDTDAKGKREQEFVCMLPVGTSAAFPGGSAALQQFICRHFTEPPDSLLPDTAVEGTVLVKFTIEKDGRVTDVGIEKGIHPAYDQAILGLIRKMPRWKPAKERGVNIQSYHRLPVIIIPDDRSGDTECRTDSTNPVAE